MKICLINNLYPPYDRGGAEQVVVKTAEGLLADGHEVVVITGAPQAIPLGEQKNFKIYRLAPANIFFYPNAHQHSWLSRLLWHGLDIFNVSNARKVKSILQQEKPDVVHTHNLMGLSFLIPRVIRSLKIRHVHTVHDVQLVEPSGLILKKYEKTWRYTGLPTQWYSALMRVLIGSPDVVISPSQFLRDFYLTRGFFSKAKVAVVRNPLTMAVSTPEKKSTGAATRFLYLGQIESHKGVTELVAAFQGLPQNIGATELHIVGSGSKLPEIKKQAAGDARIHLHGRVARQELPRILTETDVTVVPSLCYENSPTVIFESFARGVPVLASNIEGIAELIRDGENGFTFAPGDVVALQKQLEWCVLNPAAVEAMSLKTSASLLGLALGDYMAMLEGLYKSKI